ncbi:MAG: peptidoglycan DD-metalloendopeptidase family protein [Wenzhouxiangellaceae bacterium]
MRHHYQIAITDCRQARHYTLTQLMRRLALALGTAVALVFCIAMLAIALLSGQVDRQQSRMAELQQRNQQIQDQNYNLLARQDELQQQVERRARELMALSDDLDQLESIIGITPPPSLPVADRISVASHTAFEKRLLLGSIPSGYPLGEATVTSEFGMREHPVVEKTRLHGGIDLRASIGTQVWSTADGVVEYAGHNPGSGMGKMIKIVHNYGFSTIYAHLDQVDVKVGQYISQGEPIGRTGNTGLSNAPHLHYEIRYLGRRLNPEPFMKWSIDRYKTVFEQEERIQWQSLARTVRNQVRVMDQPSSRPAASLSVISP